jgi:hypothetical protein
VAGITGEGELVGRIHCERHEHASGLVATIRAVTNSDPRRATLHQVSHGATGAAAFKSVVHIIRSDIERNAASCSSFQRVAHGSVASGDWGSAAGKGVDEALRAIADRYGLRRADFVAMQLEYPRQRALQ